jgi:tetratricopeptide (TPR) repeat protein
LREQVYRVALSALVSALPKAESTQRRSELIARIQRLIGDLRAEIGDAPENQKRLVDVFYSLARGMERQLTLLDNLEDRRVLSEGFQAFLNEVRGQSDDLSVLNWVAESFTSLGDGLREGTELTEASRACFRHAVTTYDQILQQAASDRMAPELLRQLTFRKAVALRDAEQFAESVKLLETVLLKDNSTLVYQQEAARTYQLWAAQPAEGRRYLTAVRGTEKNTQSGIQVVWGWSRIASVIQRNREYREDYYEARYNWALCHYSLAVRLRKESDRQEFLKQAQDVLVVTHRLYPTLGGQKWLGKYNALLKTIQQAQGERAVGFARQ